MAGVERGTYGGRQAEKDAIDHFILHAKPGDKFVYHVGFLAADRMDFKELVPVMASQFITNVVAEIAWRLYRKGVVALVQRRLGDGRYSYEMQRLASRAHRV